MAQTPSSQLARLANLLGWPELRTCRHDDTTWYESGKSEGGRNDLFLQINHSRRNQNSYFGAVYAIRYRICSGWHLFTLPTDDEAIVDVADRLDCWLNHKWFATLQMRRKFRESHPECKDFSWKRIRDEGPPYTQL